MKLKMNKRPTLKAWAEKFGIDIHIAEQYQRARRNWQNRVSAFARKYGGIKSKDIPVDVRDLTPQYGLNFEDYIESRAVTIANRSSQAEKYLKDRQTTYLKNLAKELERQDPDSVESEKLNEWLRSASTYDKAELISKMGGAGLTILGGSPTAMQKRFKKLSDKERMEEYQEFSDQFEYDLSKVQEAVNEVIK